MHLGARDDRRHFLLLNHLPFDELFDIRVIRINDHHLGRAPGGAARFDRAGGPVTDFQEAHEARGFATAGELLTLTAQVAEIRAGTGAVFEEPRLTNPEVHDPAFIHQIILHALDETGMRLRMLVRRGGFGQLAGLVVDIVVPLRRTVDTIGPVQTSVEPLRAVRRRHLARQHQLHLIEIGTRIFLGGEIAPFPTPIGPSPGETPEDLLGRCFPAIALVFRQSLQRLFVGHVALQERGDTLLFHWFQSSRHPGLPEILLRDHIGRHLAPTCGHFDVIKFEDGGAIGVANLR